MGRSYWVWSGNRERFSDVKEVVREERVGAYSGSEQLFPHEKVIGGLVGGPNLGWGLLVEPSHHDISHTVAKKLGVYLFQLGGRVRVKVHEGYVVLCLAQQP